jgi:hypothetical protein
MTENDGSGQWIVSTCSKNEKVKINQGLMRNFSNIFLVFEI